MKKRVKVSRAIIMLSFPLVVGCKSEVNSDKISANPCEISFPEELTQFKDDKFCHDFLFTEDRCEENVILEHWEYEFTKEGVMYDWYGYFFDSKEVTGLSLFIYRFKNLVELKVYEDFMNNSGLIKAPRVYCIRKNDLITLGARAMAFESYLNSLEKDFIEACDRIYD